MSRSRGLAFFRSRGAFRVKPRPATPTTPPRPSPEVVSAIVLSRLERKVDRIMEMLSDAADKEKTEPTASEEDPARVEQVEEVPEE